jgi:succinate-acetate transporter protein
MAIRNRERNVREDVERVEDDRTRIFLQPIAAPSILGLYGFFGATFIVATYLAGWYGGTNVPYYLFPFAAFFGGLAQFLAGMWSYKARDGLATAMHGMWGSFWMAYGLLYFLAATGTVTLPTGPFVELGFWFIVLAAITWVGTWQWRFDHYRRLAVHHLGSHCLVHGQRLDAERDLWPQGVAYRRSHASPRST